MNAPGYVALIGGSDVPELSAALARRGLRGALFSVGGRLATRQPDDIVDVFEVVDFRRPLGVVRRIAELHETLRFNAIVGVAEFGRLPAALAAEKLGLPGPSVRAVTNTREKGRMRRILEQKGLGQLRFAECRSANEVAAFQRRVQGAVIVKPSSGTGSDGVSRIDSEADAATAFSLATSAPGAQAALCEEFIDGPEVSVEGVTVDGVFTGVAVTDKRTDANYLETGHDQPTALSPSGRAAAFALAQRVTEALGLRDGVSHTEMRIGKSGPVLIETHTRMGGDRIPVLTHRTSGVDLADVIVGLALGERPTIRPVESGRAAVIRFLLGRPGRVRDIDVPSALPAGIEEVRMEAKGGHTVLGRSSSFNRLGHVLASGSELADVVRSADSFLSRICVTYDDATEEGAWASRVAS